MVISRIRRKGLIRLADVYFWEGDREPLPLVDVVCLRHCVRNAVNTEPVQVEFSHPLESEFSHNRQSKSTHIRQSESSHNRQSKSTHNRQSKSFHIRQSEPFHTLHIPLQSQDRELLSSFHKHTRKLVQDAAAMGFLVQTPHVPGAHELRIWLEWENAFRRDRGLPLVDLTRILALWERNAFELSSCAEPAPGEPLIRHAYVVDAKRAMCLFSSSAAAKQKGLSRPSLQERSMNHFDKLADSPEEAAHQAAVCAANRWLHWQDMRAYRDTGRRIYDFCGLTPGSEDPAMQHIDQFKRSFGGTETTEWHGYLGLTPKGKVFLWLYGNWIRIRGVQNHLM